MTAIDRSEYHPDLRRLATPLKAFPNLIKRPGAVRVMNALSDKLMVGRDVKGLACDTVSIPSANGTHRIRARVYRPLGHDGPLPAMLYIHGGGYIMGCPELSGSMMKGFLDTRPCVIIAPAYRRALEAPFPAGFDDCWDTLRWIRDNRDALGLAPGPFIVGGHSAGGGLTAAITLKARDTGDVPVAFQMPFYPMIDDTQPDDPARAMNTPVWSTESNRTGWNAYLADLRRSGEDIPAYAAPARAADLAGLPPTMTFVGTMEPFHAETLAYVEGLRAAGVEVAFKEYEGAFHGFEAVVPKAAISRDALAFTNGTYADFYDRHVAHGA